MNNFTTEVSATAEVSRSASPSKRRRIRKVCALALALCMVSSGSADHFIPATNDNPSNIVVVEAASTAKNDKTLSGESRLYVSNAFKGEICIKVNTEKGVNNLLSFLKLLRDNATKGRNVLSSVVFKQGTKYFPGITGKAVSAVLAVMISKINTNGIQNSSKKAISEIEQLHKKYPSKGIKIYLSPKPWKVSVQ